MKVYMAIPFDPDQGHCGDLARVFSRRKDAMRYAKQQQHEDSWLDWEVVDYELDAELVDN
jgi:hypothetical protein